MKSALHILNLLFFVFSLQASNPDSILWNIQHAEVQSRMDLWNDWMENPSKDNILILKENLHLAFQDAEQVYGLDSALLWKVRKQGPLMVNYQAFGYVNLATEVLDEMKIIADSLVEVHQKMHWKLGVNTFTRICIEKLDVLAGDAQGHKKKVTQIVSPLIFIRSELLRMFQLETCLLVYRVSKTFSCFKLN